MHEFFNAVELARFQFAFTVSAHIIFPAFMGPGHSLAGTAAVWRVAVRLRLRATYAKHRQHG